jgi:hypothetical protein
MDRSEAENAFGLDEGNTSHVSLDQGDGGGMISREGTPVLMRRTNGNVYGNGRE